MTDHQPVRVPDAEELDGFKSKQNGCIGVLLFIGSIIDLIAGAIILYFSIHFYANNPDEGAYYAFYYPDPYRLIFGAVIGLCISMALLQIVVEDMGDHLRVEYGPLRYCLCGMGKTKIMYKDIKHWEVSRSCSYGFGVSFGAKFFSQCSVGLCCWFDHSIMRITVKERYQGHDVTDNNDCCLERIPMQCCCDGGVNAEWCGNGCIFKCCNGCQGNCCRYNTIYISTRKSTEFIKLLEKRAQNEALI